MDDTSCLRSLCTVSDGPLSYLIGADCEEAAKVESLAHSSDDLWQRRLCAERLALLLGLLVSLESREAFFEADGNRNDWIARCVLLAPFCDLGQVLVLLADVVLLAKVDKIYDRLGRQEEQRVDSFNLLIVSAELFFDSDDDRAN